jgi:hypothetical protein
MQRPKNPDNLGMIATVAGTLVALGLFALMSL